jgi:hypothetical protein
MEFQSFLSALAQQKKYEMKRMFAALKSKALKMKLKKKFSLLILLQQKVRRFCKVINLSFINKYTHINMKKS